MTEDFDRRQHRFPESRYFEDLAVGERFYIPEPHRHRGQFRGVPDRVSADNHPIHYDVEYCRERGHPGPLAHGFQVLCFTAAGAGTFAHVIGDSLIAFIEQSSKFLKPVYPGDTLYPSLCVAALTAQRTTGIVTVAVTVHNQNNDLVLDRRAEIPAEAAPSARGGHAAAVTAASTSAARSQSARETSRWVTARTVRGPSAETSTPASLARATTAAASGRPGPSRNTTMLVCTVARSRHDARTAGEPLGDQPRVGVVLREAGDMMVERVEPGGGENAGLPHRAAEHAARPHARGRCRPWPPASTLPTGQPSPFDSATETRSNGLCQFGEALPGRRPRR